MTVPKYPVIMDTTWPLDNTIGYSKFCITNHLKCKLQSVCIFLIKDTNCNTVCTSPEGGMDIQIKTLHRCMNEYNSSLQYVKGGQYKLLTKVKCCNMCFCTRREEDIIASCYFSNHNFCYSKLISWFSSIFHENH
jgi:hypothetical protein